MPPPNTPEEGVTAPSTRPASPLQAFAPSPHPNTTNGCATPGDSGLLEIDYQALEYVGPVDETLLCPVCRTPFHAPITTSCGHTFCADCISRALEIHPVCPIDRRPLNKARDYHTLPLIVKDQLDRLKVKCPNRGCDYECSRDLLEGHYERHCEFTLVPCPDPQCNKRIARRDALSENGCMHQEVPCEYCDKIVLVSELEAHYDTDCTGATTDCPQCQGVVLRPLLEMHKAQVCPEGETNCRWRTAGCKVSGKRRVVQEHEQEGCMFEAVGRLMEQRAEDMKMMQDLNSRVQLLELRHRRRRDRRSDMAGGQVVDSPAGAMAAFSEFDVLPPIAENNTLAAASAEDYMLAQFERMEAQMDDLRKSLLDVDAHQSLSLLQQSAAINEQLAELSAKIGVLTLQTNWLLNITRHMQQRSNSSSGSSGGSGSSGPHNSSDSRGGRDGNNNRNLPRRGASSSDSGGLPRHLADRRGSVGRGEHPPRL